MKNKLRYIDSLFLVLMTGLLIVSVYAGQGGGQRGVRVLRNEPYRRAGGDSTGLWCTGLGSGAAGPGDLSGGRGDAYSDKTRQMVGEVVLNRAADKRYPATSEGVICQQGQYGRLHWTGPVWPERAASFGEQHAVSRAYEAAWSLLISKTERLLPEDVIYQAEFPQGTEVVAEANGLYFCR